MRICDGKSVLNGIAVGRLAFYQRQKKGRPERRPAADAEAEIRRFSRARRQAVGELEALYQQALREAGKEKALIFDMHKLLLKDQDYLEGVERYIRQEAVCAQYAVSAVGEIFAARFTSMADEYMKARSADVQDVTDRLVRLLGEDAGAETEKNAAPGLEGLSEESAVPVREKPSADVVAPGSEGLPEENAVSVQDKPSAEDAVSDPEGLSEKSAAPVQEKPSAEDAPGREPVILLAEDLSPSEVMRLNRDRVLALVLRQGSVNSHTAILIGAMNIPALVQTDVDFLSEYQGIRAVVDGTEGKLILDPDAAALSEMEAKKRRFEQERAELSALIGLENVTAGGRRINVHANVGSLAEVDMALHSDAGGIGLFRSEFLYLGRDACPTEEEQFRIYRDAVRKMEGKRVVIRTLDLGADKRAAYLGLPEEENPAMGFRAVRVSLSRPELFQAQLRAICRAAAWGRTAVLFPMIISVDEIRQCRAMLEQARASLVREGQLTGPVEVGAMIETPAAVMISRELAEEVDFLSIGTNDLTQYALALDRQNPSLERLYDPHHPAVLSMIRMTVENGHRAGAWVGICGELAGDTSLTELFLDLGVDELSVAPSRILGLRRAIRAFPR